MRIPFAFSCLLASMSSYAHFMVLIPSDSSLEHGDAERLTLSIRFSHPFEQQILDMAFPDEFGVVTGGGKVELPSSLEPVRAGGLRSYRAQYDVSRPGDHVFFVAPQPYWEPAEGRHIVHYAKTVVNAYGLQQGWDARVGLPAEIVPLARPYGLWTGHLFTGQVLVGGRPIPNAGSHSSLAGG